MKLLFSEILVGLAMGFILVGCSHVSESDLVFYLKYKDDVSRMCLRACAGKVVRGFWLDKNTSLKCECVALKTEKVEEKKAEKEEKK